jgi:excisionase family DNA binding protein
MAKAIRPDDYRDWSGKLTGNSAMPHRRHLRGGRGPRPVYSGNRTGAWPGKEIGKMEDHWMDDNRSVKADQQPGAAMPQLMNAEDVAKILKIAKKTVHKLVREGKLGCVQVTEKDRRFTPEQVQAYIDSQTVNVRIDKKSVKPVRSTPPKGGEKSVGFSRTDLREEMRSWR